MRDLHEIDVCVTVSVLSGFFLIDRRTNVPPASPLARGEQPGEVANRLLRAATGLVDGHWVVLREVGVHVPREGPLLLLYAAELPEPVSLGPDYCWRTHADLEGDPVKDLFVRGWRTRC